jgi:hypothetical protein
VDNFNYYKWKVGLLKYDIFRWKEERIILKFLSIQTISSISLTFFLFSLTCLQQNTSLFIALDMTLKIRNKNI